MSRSLLFFSTLLLMPAPIAAQTANAHAAHPSPSVGTGTVRLLDGLGTHHRPIRTRVPAAQRYFDQGLRLYYAFNHDEALRAFQEASRLDPACALCAAGEALVQGPNINAPMDPSLVPAAQAAVERAARLARNAHPRDAGFIAALRARYAPDQPRARLDSAYADAMIQLARGNPADDDLLVLAAEAEMLLSPWAYWTADGRPRGRMGQMLHWLETVETRNRTHPGACHFLIHAVEAVEPERAVPCAERLAKLMPGAGHLVHMPAHIYVRVGRWAEAIDANRHAVHADDQLLATPGVRRRGSYETGYASHNWHFLAFAATMAGNSRIARDASHAAGKAITPEMARGMPSIEAMLVLPFEAAVSFGRWAEVLQLPLPADGMPFALGIARHARGVAHAARGNDAAAAAELAALRPLVAQVPEGDARTAMQIAVLVLEAERHLRRGEAIAAVPILQGAAALEDGMTYMEPPVWFAPVRHVLGRALLAAGEARAAERAYQEDLARFPENGWALQGLRQALLAQNRTADAAQVERRLAVAWRNADVTLVSSRF